MLSASAVILSVIQYPLKYKLFTHGLKGHNLLFSLFIICKVIYSDPTGKVEGTEETWLIRTQRGHAKVSIIWVSILSRLILEKIYEVFQCPYYYTWVSIEQGSTAFYILQQSFIVFIKRAFCCKNVFL